MYDFIFMDINLTEMSGTEATKFIRNIEKDHGQIRTNIIAVSIDSKQQSDFCLFDHYGIYFILFSDLSKYYDYKIIKLSF